LVGLKTTLTTVKKNLRIKLKENNEIKIKNREKKKGVKLKKEKEKSFFDYMIGYLYNDTQVF
jgi:hypothetical protein